MCYRQLTPSQHHVQEAERARRHAVEQQQAQPQHNAPREPRREATERPEEAPSVELEEVE